jgi:UDP-2,4-diacetamido-2,4,6-trideoxy-beta-L-altropyranose hydrolase
MNILFRVDASLEIGFGHAARCVTLAKALKNRGAQCTFVCRNHPGNAAKFIEEQGFQVQVLDLCENKEFLAEAASNTERPYAKWLGAEWSIDAKEVRAFSRGELFDWIVVDHYGIDHRWEAALRSSCQKLLVIDDLANRFHVCDVLLDQNLIANFQERYKSLTVESCACLLGPDYALLQPEYELYHRRTPPRLAPITRILVYFGGADQKNVTERVVAAFLGLERKDVIMDVVVSSQSPYHASIQDLIGTSDNIFLHSTIPSLAQLMVQADFSIGASGATSWERCCLGVPAHVVTLAENQKPIAEELDRRGFINWLGDQENVSVESLKGALLDALSTNVRLYDWSAQCRSLVDGKGTERVADILTLCAQTPLVARHAEVEDEALILNWANDPIVRKNAFNPDSISADTHRLWFYRRLRNPKDCKIFIIETQNGLPLGQFRFEKTGEEWEVHYSLASLARGRKLATLMMQTAIQEFRRQTTVARFFAQVKDDNIPSLKVFERLGFSVVESGFGKVRFQSPNY